MTRGEKAEALFKEGFNCSQAVAVAFADVLELPEDTVARLASGFGGGMSRLREICGAFSAVVMVLGMARGYSDPKERAGKAALYADVQRLAEAYRAQNGSYICRELLGLPAGKSAPVPEARTDAYYKKRPCAQLCRAAAELLEAELALSGS